MLHFHGQNLAAVVVQSPPRGHCESKATLFDADFVQQRLWRTHRCSPERLHLVRRPESGFCDETHLPCVVLGGRGAAEERLGKAEGALRPTKELLVIGGRARALQSDGTTPIETAYRLNPMANNTQASKFVDEESKPPGAAPKYVSSSHRQLLDLTDAEIDRSVDVLGEADRGTAPISGLRRVVTPTLSQLSWDLAEIRRLLHACDTGLVSTHGSSQAGRSEAVSVREKLRAELHTLIQEQLERAGRALRELQETTQGTNPRLERELAMSIALLRRELKKAL